MSSVHFPTFPSLHLLHNSFSNPSVGLPTSQLILQRFRCFTYVTVHSPTFFRFSYVTSSSINELCSFSNLSVTSPKAQLILQPFRCFTYVSAHSPTLPLLYLRHSSFSKPFFRFSYVTSSSLNSPGEPLMTRTWFGRLTRKYTFDVLGRVNISGHWRPQWMSMDENDGQMIFGDIGGLKLPDICLTGEVKPRKNLTRETCPDRGSNPGPQLDKRACYHLLHSGGPYKKEFKCCHQSHTTDTS